MRVNINIPDELLKQIDAKAKSLFVTRTAYIVLAVKQKLDSDALLDNIPGFTDALKELNEKLPSRSF